jgi:hypothetical protein
MPHAAFKKAPYSASFRACRQNCSMVIRPRTCSSCVTEQQPAYSRFAGYSKRRHRMSVGPGTTSPTKARRSTSAVARSKSVRRMRPTGMHSRPRISQAAGIQHRGRRIPHLLRRRSRRLGARCPLNPGSSISSAESKAARMATFHRE